MHDPLARAAGFGLSRRDLFRTAVATTCGLGLSPWMARLAAASPAAPRRRCVLLWMTGGPSQLDTFDLKPGHANGGEFQEIGTAVPGLRFSEHLPKLAAQADRLALLRGVGTKEGDHGRGTHLMHTGHAPGGPVRYPTLGSLLSKELGDAGAELPAFVSVAPFRVFNEEAYSAGFLGPRYAALSVTATEAAARSLSVDDVLSGSALNVERFARLGIEDLRAPRPLPSGRSTARLDLLRSFQADFAATHADASSLAQRTVYDRALRLMNGAGGEAFDLSAEPDAVRERYGRGTFGQGCLLARRLVERGVSFVEVNLGGPGGGPGWDTHADNFNAVKNLSGELDAGWSALMSDLADRGLLDETTIVWMGEFGRTPAINAMAGRDHFPDAWTCVLAGGGIRGGQAHGRTSPDGMTIADGETSVGDVLATVCAAVGVDPAATNASDGGRPIKLAEGKPVREVLA